MIAISGHFNFPASFSLNVYLTFKND